MTTNGVLPRRQLSMAVSEIRASVFADLAPHIRDFEASGGRLFPLHIGDTHHQPPEASKFERVLADRAARSDRCNVHEDLYRYGPLGGTPRLREAVSQHLRANGRGRPGVMANHVLVTAGATHAMSCAAHALLNPGDEVIVLAPYWPLAIGVLRSSGAVPVETCLPLAPGKSPTASEVAVAIERALSPGTRAIYFSTPNNPAGFVLSPDALGEIGRIAREHDLWVLSDEVYAECIYDGEHLSIGMLPDLSERVAAFYSFSKSHALAGARVGVLVASQEVIEAASKVATHSVFNVPVLAQECALRALGETEGWLVNVRESYRRARDDAARVMSEARIPFASSAGGSYLFLDLREVLRGRAPVELFQRLIHRGVLLAPGDAFGTDFAGWARLCFTALPHEPLSEAMKRLTDVVGAFR